MEPTNNHDIDDDYVRPPDPVIRERLVDFNDDFNNYNYNYNDNDADLDQILKESLAEFELAEEQKAKELVANQRMETSKKYTIIKQKLQKIQGHDATNKETYNSIISIIELYELDYLETYPVDELNYNNIFKLLRTIRLTSVELNLLESLITL